LELQLADYTSKANTFAPVNLMVIPSSLSALMRSSLLLASADMAAAAVLRMMTSLIALARLGALFEGVWLGGGLNQKRGNACFLAYFSVYTPIFQRLNYLMFNKVRLLVLRQFSGNFWVTLSIYCKC